MPIFIDPTEAIAGRLPDGVKAAAQVLTGLEARTCADIMLSTCTEPLALDGSRLSEIRLRHHLDRGMLIQRKTTDLISSITDMKRILSTMLNADAKYGAWLLFIGDLTQIDGLPYIDGQPTKHGGQTWATSTVLGTFIKWQMRGGYVAQIKHGGMLSAWLGSALDIMQKVDEQPVVTPELHVPQQKILTTRLDPETGEEKDNKNWRTTLMTFPDIGLKTANDIADRSPNLAWALIDLCDPAKSAAICKKARRWMGLDVGQEIALTDEDSRRLWRQARIETDEKFRVKQKEWDKWVKEFSDRFPFLLNLKRSTVEDLITTFYPGMDIHQAVTELLARQEMIVKNEPLWELQGERR